LKGVERSDNLLLEKQVKLQTDIVHAYNKTGGRGKTEEL